MPDAIDAGTIQDNAEGPRQVSGDGITIEQHSLPDQKIADQYIEAKRAMRLRHWPFRMFKIKPRGSF